MPFVRVHTSVFCFQCGLDKAPGFSSVKREGTFFVILVYLDVAYFRCTHTHTHTHALTQRAADVFQVGVVHPCGADNVGKPEGQRPWSSLGVRRGVIEVLKLFCCSEHQ